MDQTTKSELLKCITEFERLDTQPLAKSNTESRSFDLVKSILSPLLSEEEYTLQTFAKFPDTTVDLMATRSKGKGHDPYYVGIVHRHFFYGQPIRDIVKKSLSFLRAIELDRALLIVNEHVAEATVEASRHTAPQIEVLDAAGLRAWVAQIDVEADINKLEIEQIMKAVSNRFAALIADDPRNLDKLEWRQIEYLVAEIFDGLGFKVTLTPSSQDGGKDVILECTVDGKDRSYIVEIKHWRSGKGVGNDAVRYFLDVLVREKRDGGLFLSTYGYANNAFESLTEIERKKVHFGTEEKLVALCRTYKKIKSGILSPRTDIAETIVANTLPLR